MEDTSFTEKKESKLLKIINDIKIWFHGAKDQLKEKISHLSAEGVGWLGTMLIHAATIPSLLGLIFAVSDKLPSLDVVFFIWSGLLLFFVRSLIKKDMLNIITNGLGFFIQAVLLAIVVFK